MKKFLLLLFFINNACFAQTFEQGAKMVRYESSKINQSSNVEYSYSYTDLGGYEILQIKLLGIQTPSHLTNETFEAFPHSDAMSNDEESSEALYKLMLKKFGITKTILEESPNCSFKGTATLEIRNLEEWSNHYDSDPGNNATIYVDTINISQPPVYKCESYELQIDR